MTQKSRELKVRVLGCHGGVAPDYQTSCYSINQRWYIDAGSLCSALTLKEQFEVEHIFITHPHLDHVKDLCFLIENTFDPSRRELFIHSTPEIIADLKKHLFNDVLWPDFSKISAQKDSPHIILKYAPMEQPLKLDHLTWTPFKVNHPGHAVGYLIDNGLEQIIFTGDTGPSVDIWNLANSCNNLVAIFTEITFPNRMEGLARASGHMTLKLLTQDLSKLKKDVPIYVSHFKPPFLSELLDEFNSHKSKNLFLLHESDELSWGS